MRLKRISCRLVLNGFIVFLIGLMGSIILIKTGSPETMELPNEYLNFHMVSLYLQPAVFLLFYKQILTFRNINVFVTVRKKNRSMIMHLMVLATIYCLIFVLGLFVPYFFTDYPLFKFGKPIVGIELILLHVLAFLLLLWLLVGGYNWHRPYLLLLMAIIIDLIYHYYIEKNILINYSPVYDELYRAIHEIYGGF
ncbi:hypothetical protein [uncultured Lactobacillus sp.]|uniref:hypothetical protein n=1 Tax=uncultured Lactobacillus sp. TaxID=153152 RepID=UPI0025FD7E25|nr:hypothetical protein [uncultured Lactobacillus sp.]